MHTDTPYFRAALSLAALWLLIVAGWCAWTIFDGYGRGLGNTWYVEDPLVERCHDPKYVFGKTGFSEREPTQAEFSACFDAAYKTKVDSQAYSNATLIKQSFWFFVLFAALPASLLLGAVSYRATLKAKFGSFWFAYWNWLRHGKERS